MSKFEPSHKPPSPYTVRIPLSGFVEVKLSAPSDKEAKAAAMEIAKQAAAEITVTATLAEDTESAIDDWKLSIPNRKGIEIKRTRKVRK